MANILVCDDDKEIVDAIEIYLSQDGYRIFKAYDGQQAIDLLQKEDIQLLIMDIMMPKLDGIRATLKIREYSSIPIIMLSAIVTTRTLSLSSAVNSSHTSIDSRYPCSNTTHLSPRWLSAMCIGVLPAIINFSVIGYVGFTK